MKHLKYMIDVEKSQLYCYRPHFKKHADHFIGFKGKHHGNVDNMEYPKHGRNYFCVKGRENKR